MFRTLATALAIAVSLPAAAQDYMADDLHISDPVIFKSFAKARAAGGYMSIENKGETSDLLIGVRVEGPMAMIHESREEDGVMRMVHLDAVEIPAGETGEFRPGGLHVMVMGLGPDDLPVGDTLDATLIFDRAGEVPIVFFVTDLVQGSAEMDHSEHGGMTN